MRSVAGTCLAIAVLCFASSAAAVCLKPMGCKPSTLEECKEEASKRPTELGVRLAVQQCHQQFSAKPAANSAGQGESGRDAMRQSQDWVKIREAKGDAYRLAVGLLGEPISQGKVHQCTDDKGATQVTIQCQWREWWSADPEDPRPEGPRLLPGETFGHKKVYRAEFQLDTGAVRRAYDKPISGLISPIQ